MSTRIKRQTSFSAGSSGIETVHLAGFDDLIDHESSQGQSNDKVGNDAMADRRECSENERQSK
jgi:hypothetical protein